MFWILSLTSSMAWSSLTFKSTCTGSLKTFVEKWTFPDGLLYYNVIHKEKHPIQKPRYCQISCLTNSPPIAFSIILYSGQCYRKVYPPFPPDPHSEALMVNVLVSVGRIRFKLSHQTGNLKWVCALIRRARQALPPPSVHASPDERLSEHTAGWLTASQEKGPSPRTQSISTFFLDFPASRTTGNKCQLLKSQSGQLYFVLATLAD